MEQRGYSLLLTKDRHEARRPERHGCVPRQGFPGVAALGARLDVDLERALQELAPGAIPGAMGRRAINIVVVVAVPTIGVVSGGMSMPIW